MIVTRFAPSPTGFLHLGHAFAALTAAKAGEQFLLRIEDIDQTRARPDFVTAIFEDLKWLGLQWHGPVLYQSQRLAAYRGALQMLERAELLYPCFCTRKEIAAEIVRAGEAPHGPEGPLYPGICRHLTATMRKDRIARGDSYALRLDVSKAAASIGALSFIELGRGPAGERGPIAADPTLFGDVVLARKDIPASYHLAVVVDDAHQNVNLVTRGNDLFAAAHVQRLLQALLGLPEPHYAHHRLILDAQGRKFSKRDRAPTLRSLRAQGETAQTIRKKLGL